MSKCTRITISLPPELAESAEVLSLLRAYESRSAYLVGLIRADAVDKVDHEIPRKIAEMGLKDRDRLDAEILQTVESRRLPVEPSPSVIRFPGAGIPGRLPVGTR